MRWIYKLNKFLGIPGLPIAKVQSNGGNTCTLRNDGWVIISDGESEDMLPITLVSESLIKKFEEAL